MILSFTDSLKRAMNRHQPLVQEEDAISMIENLQGVEQINIKLQEVLLSSDSEELWHLLIDASDLINSKIERIYEMIRTRDFHINKGMVASYTRLNALLLVCQMKTLHDSKLDWSEYFQIARRYLYSDLTLVSKLTQQQNNQ